MLVPSDLWCGVWTAQHTAARLVGSPWLRGISAVHVALGARWASLPQSGGTYPISGVTRLANQVCVPRFMKPHPILDPESHEMRPEMSVRWIAACAH